LKGVTVALIGADGAGKTTIGRRLEHSLAMPATYLYMGVNAEASNHLLPTTRLVRAAKRKMGRVPDSGPPDPRPTERAPTSSSSTRRFLSGARAVLRLLNRLAEEWHRQLLAWRHVRRGEVVVFDRHFFADYYSHDVAEGGPRSITRRLHGFVLQRLYPRPDLVVFLDAPPETLFARKGEGSIEALRRRRQDYLDVAPHCRNFVSVNADRSLDTVTADVVAVVNDFVGRQHRS
jgi:thymidylate kinase